MLESATMTTNDDDYTVLSHVSSSPAGDRPRWLEVTISRSAAGRFRVQTVGRSTVDGEEDRVRTDETTSAHAVVDLLAWTDANRRFIAKTIRTALHEAAEHVPELGDALDDFDSVHA